MTLTNPIKILIGLLTLLIIVVPFVIMPLFFAVSMLPAFAAEFGKDMLEPPVFLGVMLVMMPVMFLYPFVQLALQAFYVIHEVKNKTLTDTARILFLLGTYFLPYIVLPVYFVMHIWRDGPKPAVEAPVPGAAG